MKNWKSTTASRVTLLALVGVMAVAVAWPPMGAAQDKKDPAKHVHPTDKAEGDKDLAAQLKELQAKVAKLEAALAKGQPGMAGMGGKGGMGMMGKGMMGMEMSGKKGMGMEGMDRDEMMKMMQMIQMEMMQMMQMMGGMKGKGMGGMSGTGGMGMEDDDMEMMGMMGMGNMGQGGMKGMKGMGKMQQAAALPGFPGASHIYHIGATGFFLDHPEHISLSTEQQAKLNKAKQKAGTDKATAQRKIDEAEQKLWELTGADEPDAGQIQAKVQEIEKLRGEQRLAFIGAVGEAAKALTDEQRKVLLGTAKPQSHQHPPSPSK